jgi:hypothetical protein
LILKLLAAPIAWAVVITVSPGGTTKPELSNEPPGTSPTTHTVEAIRRSIEACSAARAGPAKQNEAKKSLANACCRSPTTPL